MNLQRRLSAFFLLFSVAFSSGADPLPMEERAAIVDQLLASRLQHLPEKLMRREGIDMWILIAREYNEDPVLMTMLPGNAFSARRRTILVFIDEGDLGVQGYAVSRYGVGDYFRAVWNPDEQPNQWQALADLIDDKNPSRIGINISSDFALADGLSHSEYEALHSVLPGKNKTKLVSAERLAIGWLETRTDEEMTLYSSIVRMAHEIIAEGFSEKVVQAEKTSTSDLEWWYRDRIRELRLNAWFHPSVSIQRQGAEGDLLGTIMAGDLLHVDFGITYLRLNTDTQQHAYVLRDGELKAPDGLINGLKTSNRLQDILTENFIIGRTGNEILRLARQQALEEDIRPSIYTHPIGYHGHGAGPTIGMWDNQGDTVGKGDYPLYPHTAYSIELNSTVSVPEWDGQDVRFKLEEDAYFDGNKTTYIDGRQLEIILIPSHDET